MTTRRRFLAATSLLLPARLPAAVSDSTNVAIDGRTLEVDDVCISWHHAPDCFTARLVTPSPGWLAFGVNDRPALAGTRFVIANVSMPDIRVSERIALVPRHAPIDALDLAPALLGASGVFRRGRSSLEVRLRPAIDARPRLRLRSGSRVHLMLAWSRETDFAHHSAWRRHVPVEL